MKATPVDINWHVALPIYASETFLKTISSEYGWLGGMDDDGSIACILPYTIIRKSMFSLIRFPVQTIPLAGEFSVEKERMFLNSAVEIFRSMGADLIIPSTNNALFRTYPDGALAAPYGGVVLDLDCSEDELWKNLHQKHRNVIRNAIKKGVVIRDGSKELETAFELVRSSFIRSAKGYFGRVRVGMRMDYSTFERQVLSFGDHVKILIAEYDGEVQGCAIIPFSNHSAYYMHGGSISNPLTGAMNLLQWEAIRTFQGLGVRCYDFFGARINPEKGSKAEGILKFKERFGGRKTQGYMWKYPISPMKYFLYSLVSIVRSGGDLVHQERHKLGSEDAAMGKVVPGTPISPN